MGSPDPCRSSSTVTDCPGEYSAGRVAIPSVNVSGSPLASTYLMIGAYAWDRWVPSCTVIRAFRTTVPSTEVRATTVCHVVAPMMRPDSHTGLSATTR